MSPAFLEGHPLNAGATMFAGPTVSWPPSGLSGQLAAWPSGTPLGPPSGSPWRDMPEWRGYVSQPSYCSVGPSASDAAIALAAYAQGFSAGAAAGCVRAAAAAEIQQQLCGRGAVSSTA